MNASSGTTRVDAGTYTPTQEEAAAAAAETAADEAAGRSTQRHGGNHGSPARSYSHSTGETVQAPSPVCEVTSDEVVAAELPTGE